MKGIICCYSGSGNTRLACQYIAKKISGIELNLHDVAKGGGTDLETCNLVGFATFTDFLGPSRFFTDFINALPKQMHKPAFVFNTYGNLNGRTLLTLAKLVSARGFEVVAGHSLHTPESYPPMIVKGKGNTQAPDENEMHAFNGFIGDLNGSIDDLLAGLRIRRRPLSVGLPDRFLPTLSRTSAKRVMGIKYVDEEQCLACGACARGCPYKAIKVREKPVFDEARCYGCWACYNHCPRQAIYTQKYRGTGHYPKPIDELKAKLGV